MNPRMEILAVMAATATPRAKKTALVASSPASEVSDQHSMLEHALQKMDAWHLYKEDERTSQMELRNLLFKTPR